MSKKISQYQIDGAYFLAKKSHALLGDQAGVGKTAQAILASDTVNAKSILIICPAVARVNWQREFSEWSVFSPTFKICESSKDYPRFKTICSYDYATENVEKLKGIEWDLIICDESHFIKEPNAKRTQAIYGKTGLVRHTERMWLLSGTPAPNNASELWPMLYTFGCTPLDFDKFTQAFCDTRPTFYQGVRRDKVVGTKKDKIPEIKEMLSKIMLRRLKKDVLKELPPISYSQLTVEGQSLLDVIEIDMQKVALEQRGLEQSLSYTSTLEEMAFIIEKLGDSVSTLRRYVGLQKVKSVAELITQELEAGAYEKIGIFAIHTDVIASLAKELAKFNPVIINGSVSAPQRQRSIDSFQNDKKTKVFIGNIQAAGTAITLTAADQCLFIEESWTPGDNAQAAARFHRRGQNNAVTVRFACLADSIDEKVSSVLRRKTEELTQIFDQ